MGQIIDCNWCQKHGMEKPGMNVATDESYYLVKDRYYIVGYTERTTGEKELFVQNPKHKQKKSIQFNMPKFNWEENKKNDFTTDDLKTMCKLVGLEYPFAEE